MLVLSRKRMTTLAEFREFSFSIEELGRTDPERALEVYTQWYLEVQRGDDDTPHGMNEGEKLRAHFRRCLAFCHEKNQGKHWKQRTSGLKPHWVFYARGPN